MKILQTIISGNHPNRLVKRNYIIKCPDMVPSQTDFEIFLFFVIFSSKKNVYEIRPIWSGFSLIEDVFILDLKKLPGGDQTMFECSKLHWYDVLDICSPSPFLENLLENKFIECVSSPYVENFTLLDSNLTTSMKTNFLSGATIKVI